jgi:AcrR family transcriptional regulator
METKYGSNSSQARRMRKHIRKTLLQMLEESGYRPVTMEALAERAEVSRSTLYRYYECIDDITGECLVDCLFVLANKRPSSTDAGFRVELYENALEACRSRRHFVKLYRFASSRALKTPDTFFYYRRLADSYHDYIVHVVKELQKERAAQAAGLSMPVEYAVAAASAACNAISITWMDGGFLLPAEDIARYQTECFLKMLEPSQQR